VLPRLVVHAATDVVVGYAPITASLRSRAGKRNGLAKIGHVCGANSPRS